MVKQVLTKSWGGFHLAFGYTIITRNARNIWHVHSDRGRQHFRIGWAVYTAHINLFDKLIICRRCW